jgi:hypothetical protein
MKRSEINALLAEGRDFFLQNGFRLPPFAFFPPGKWRDLGPACRGIAECGLGWDVTDFGFGRFDEIGLLLFTLRNGTADGRHPKPYAEKVMMVRENQVTPLHFHASKTEDIINRGGASLVFRLHRADASDGLSPEPVEFEADGIRRTLPAGGLLALSPGESVTFPPGLCHSFWAEGGPVMAGEVSAMNDDRSDNVFHEPVGRFPLIEEDAEPLYLLCNEYRPHLK